MKKTLAFLMALVLVLGMAPGMLPAMAETAAKQPITLTWFNVGNEQQKDYNMVKDHINDLLHTYEGLEHVNLEFITTGWGNCNTRLNTMIASGDAPDLFNPCAAGYIVTWVHNEACADITDLVAEHRPEIFEELPEWLLQTQTIDGRLYAIPTFQQNNANHYAYFFPTELAEKYLDIEALTAMTDFDAETQEEALAGMQRRYEILTDYLEKCYEAGEIDRGAFNDIQTFCTSFYQLNPRYMYDYSPDYGDNPTPVVTYGSKTLEEIKYAAETGIESPVHDTAYGYLYDWFTKGYIRSDVLSTNNNDLVGNGFVFWVAQSIGNSDPAIHATNEQAVSGKYGFDITIVPQSYTYTMRSDNASGGHAVFVDSKYKEEAVKVAALTALEAGAPLLNAIVYGIEGVHYTMNDDGTITTPYSTTAAGNDDNYGQNAWAFGNIFNAYINQGTDPAMFEFIKEMHQTAYPNKVAGFSVNLTAFEMESALCKALADESVIYDLTNGYGSTTYREAKKKYYNDLLASGVESILTEHQRQVDAFLSK